MAKKLFKALKDFSDSYSLSLTGCRKVKIPSKSKETAQSVQALPAAVPM